MSSREKRASLSAGLLVPKDIASGADLGAAAADGADGEHRDDAAEPAPPDAAAEAAPPAVLSAAMLSKKGTASAAGFRPEYWSYDPAVKPLPAETSAVVPLSFDPPSAPASPAVVPLHFDTPRFETRSWTVDPPATAPDIPASPQTPVEAAPQAAPVAAAPVAAEPPGAGQTRSSVLILGLGCIGIAIAMSVTVYFLSGAGPGDRSVPAPPAAVVAAQPAAPVAAGPATPVAAETGVTSAPSTPVVAAQPAEPAAPVVVEKDVASSPGDTQAAAAPASPPADAQDAAPALPVEAQPGTVATNVPAPEVPALEVRASAPVAAPPEDAPVAALLPDEIDSLMLRGSQLLATGDIAAARLFFQRAAEQGSGPAATEVGKTFDPLFLEQSHVRGIRGDAAAAAAWYRKAAAAGDPQGQTRLDRLTARFPG
jgi:hypothetical protein